MELFSCINVLISFLLYLRINLALAISDCFYFIANPQSQDVEEGKSLTMSCAVNVNDSIKYRWLRNREMLETNSENSRYQLKMQRDLYIPNVDFNLDKGSYECHALNTTTDFSQGSSSAEVNIYYLNPIVELRTNFDDLSSIKEGNKVVLSCLSEAFPPVQPSNIFWFRDGSTRMPETVINSFGQLEIESLGPQHYGTYSCSVRHSSGYAISRSSILFQNFDDREEFSAQSNVYIEPKYWSVQSSQKLQCSDSIKYNEGHPLTFHWTYTKTLGGTFNQINSLDPKDIKVEGHELIINNFNRNLANYYKCEIKGISEEFEVTFMQRVEVAFLEDLEMKNFSPLIRRGRPFPAILGEPLSIRYYTDSTPQKSFIDENISNPFPLGRWYSEKLKQYIPSRNSTNSNLPIYTDHNGYSINFQRVSETHAGRYQFSLENEAGMKKMDFDLIVVYKPIIDAIHEYLEKDENEKLEWLCTTAQLPDPGSLIQWFKDGHFLAGETNNRLLRSQLHVRDQGQYNCSIKIDGISNEITGNSFDLVIKAKLRIEEPKGGVVFLEHGKPGLIPCQVTGYGNVNMKWYDANKNLLGSKIGTHEYPYHIDSVDESFSGDYRCEAVTDYKNGRVTKVIKVIVGETPKIKKISEETYVKIGSDILLNCEAGGLPKPQVSWIFRNHSFTSKTSISYDEKIHVFLNGTFKKSQATLDDSGVYRCETTNSFGFQDTADVNVTVLTENVYYRRINRDSHSRMSKMVAIVVGCALLYLALMLVITIFCSLGMIRSKQSSSYPKGFDNRNQLLPTTNFQSNNDSNGLSAINNGSFFPMTNQNGSCLSSQSGIQSLGNQGYSLITDSNGYTEANQINPSTQQNMYPNNNAPSSYHNNLVKCNTMASNLTYN